jgi:hypothetical protein
VSENWNSRVNIMLVQMLPQEWNQAFSIYLCVNFSSSSGRKQIGSISKSGPIWRENLENLADWPTQTFSGVSDLFLLRSRGLQLPP